MSTSGYLLSCTMAMAGSLWGVVGPTHGGARMRAMDTDPYRTLVAAHDADRPCLVLADGPTWTYGDMRDRAGGLGGARRGGGVGRRGGAACGGRGGSGGVASVVVGVAK